MKDIALVHATFGAQDEAERIAETVIAERLAACVTIADASTSIYRWRGTVERAREYGATFKTTPLLARRLSDRLSALHGYELPVVEAWTVAVSDAVAEWVAAETG